MKYFSHKPGYNLIKLLIKHFLAIFILNTPEIMQLTQLFKNVRENQIVLMNLINIHVREQIMVNSK